MSERANEPMAQRGRATPAGAREAVQHVVLLRFDPPLDATGTDELVGMLRPMPSIVDGFLRLRFGADRNGGARAAGYQFLMFSEHTDPAALRAYLIHPEHVTLANWVAERNGNLLAFDYPIDDTTTLL